MPIEVYPIEGSYDGKYFNHTYNDRTPKDVAEEIKVRYQKIVDAGGKIVATHEVGHNRFHDPGVDEDYIYIVADIPESSDTNS